MKFCYGFIIFFLFAGLSNAQEIQQIGKSVPAFSFQINEWMDVDIKLQHTRDGEPLLYSSHLETDVCSDGLCKPISITIYWDLLGRFLSYHTDEKHPLTKFDHIELTNQDHVQLHKILSDTASILRDYEVEDMIDTTVHLQSLKLDAVTGATSETFDGVTVEGALYTVYTLWHFTNGPVRKDILKYTESLLSDPFVNHMLLSNNRDYVSFIFEHLTEQQNNKFVNNIVSLISNDDIYIPHFAIAQLTDGILSNNSHQHKILEYFSRVDSSVKNALLERFRNIKFDSKGLEIFISFIDHINENQSAKVFSIIENNKSQLNKNSIGKIETLSESSNRTIAHQAKSILQRIK